MRTFQKFSDFKNAVAEGRSQAQREGEKYFGFVRSRGTMIGTVSKDGSQCNPYPGADACSWTGSKKELDMVVEKILAQYPEVHKIEVFGGYDGWETFRGMITREEDYAPWVSSWEVAYWTRD